MDLIRLEKVFANPKGPTVLWLQGSSCTGCSISFLNRISAETRETASDILINSINLTYHSTLMSLAGESAAAVAQKAYTEGGYILAVEGGIPTAFDGNTCWAWSSNGIDVTFQQAVTDLASRATSILCVGTCAAWGGIPAAPPNLSQIKGVKALTGRKTINVAGCPPHPDWIVWTIVQLLQGRRIALDRSGRPSKLFNTSVHDTCSREDSEEACSLGMDKRCLEELGCRGEHTMARCGRDLWNNKVNWCCDANAVCIGCTERGFPGIKPFHTTAGDCSAEEIDD
jgi:hydrogenase small subunit